MVSYGEVWKYLQSKSRQYGPKEKTFLTPIAPPPKTTALPTKSELVATDGKKRGHSFTVRLFFIFLSLPRVILFRYYSVLTLAYLIFIPSMDPHKGKCVEGEGERREVLKSSRF